MFYLLDGNNEAIRVEFIKIYPETALAGIEGGTAMVSDQVDMPFRRHRIKETGIDLDRSRVFKVSGDPMLPTLPEGTTILVDYKRTELKDNCLYVFRTNGSLLIKRAKQCDGKWWWMSDNPIWDPIKLTRKMKVWGLVRWYGRLVSDEGI